MEMRTLGGRLDTKISIIMNVFHAHLELLTYRGLARERVVNGGRRWDGVEVYKRLLYG